jgi:hypothetical protein
MITGLTDQSAASLRRRRAVLLRKLPPLKEVLRGSLIKRYKRCGKPGCKCAKGPGHGPKYYLSISQSGSNPQMDYVPLAYHDQAVAYLSNHRLIRQILDEICEINRELLRRREKL